MQFYGCLAQQFNDIPREEFWRELRRVGEAYLAAGKERTRFVHALVDTTLDSLIARDQRYGYAPPFCHKGCCNCCHELVYCTDEEAMGILEYCQQQGIAIDTLKLQRQLQYVVCDEQGDHTGETTWNDQPRADQSCIFLDAQSGSCRVWPVRPLVCRVHLAEETNEFCAPYNGQENLKAQGIDYIELSYVASVVFTLHRQSVRQTMGRLLLSTFPRFRRA